MYFLVDEDNVVVACSNNAITATNNGYMVDGTLYLKNHLVALYDGDVTSQCVQTKCFCKGHDNCIGSECIHYSECYVGGVNHFVYTNPNYGEVDSYSGKQLIIDELKTIKPSLEVSPNNTFPAIADSIDTMLDDATAVVTDIRRNDSAYNGSGKISGNARVVDTYNTLEEVDTSILVEGDIVEVIN